jgi:hypothetical protein
MGGRVSYAPKKKGARSYQPILTFLAETREYIAGQLRNGDRPSAEQIQAHLQQAFSGLPEGVREFGRAPIPDFYSWQTVAAYEAHHCQFIIVARKTARLVERLTHADWRPSPHSSAAAEREFFHAGRLGVSYSDQYPERSLLHQTMSRLRRLPAGLGRGAPSLTHVGV